MGGEDGGHMDSGHHDLPPYPNASSLAIVFGIFLPLATFSNVYATITWTVFKSDGKGFESHNLY